METENNAKLISLVATVLIVVLLFLLFYLCPLLPAMPTPKDMEKGEIVLVAEPEEEFVEIIEPAPAQNHADAPAQAQTPEPKATESQAAPEGGTDLTDKGPQGQKPPVVTAKEESPMKVKKEDSSKEKQGQATAPKPDPKEQEIKRKAQNDVANALTKGKNNAATSASADNGPAGTPSSTTAVGTGKGRVGGGWNIPAYGNIKSPVTGSIVTKVAIDSSGKVLSVEVIDGGVPPAATNPTVVAAVMRELKSRKFTHPNLSEAQPATAYITFTFK